MTAPTAAQLRRMASNPATFRRHLRIEDDRQLGDCLDDWQAADFEATDPAWMRIAGVSVDHVPFWRAWHERPRGHSKSQDAALMALWALAFARRKIVGVVCATDRDQAGLIRQGMDRLISLNPWLAEVVEVSQFKAVGKRNGAELTILSSDVASSWGLLVDFAICDEVSAWPNDGLWVSILSTIAKKHEALLLVALNAGSQSHWSYETRGRIDDDPAWYFHALPDSCASWVSRERLEEQERLLPPAAFDRLFRNVWAAGDGDLLDANMLAACICRDLSLSGHPRPNHAYALGLDLGLRRDRSAVSIVSRTPQGRFDCVHTHHWTPSPDEPISVATVRDYIRQLHSQFGFTRGYADPWQGEMLRDELVAAGVPLDLYTLSEPGWDALARHVINVFKEGRTLLPDGNALLLNELQHTRIIEKTSGRLRFDWPRQGNSHGDVAMSYCLALMAAKSATAEQQSFEIGDYGLGRAPRSTRPVRQMTGNVWGRKNHL